MKRLFYIIMFFLALTLTSLLGSFETSITTIESQGSIQGIKKETITLISNNFSKGEIISSQEKNNQNPTISTPHISTYNSSNSIYDKYNPQLNGCFIHNLSTDKEKVHPIRAP